MIKRLIKIISCVLILAIIIAIAIAPIYSQAIAAPIIIGGVALAIGGIAWAITSAMGASFNYSSLTSDQLQSTFDPYYSVQTALTTSDFTFIKGLRTGYDALQLSLTAFNAIKQGSQNLINDNNLQDNDSGYLTEQFYDNDIPFNSTFTALGAGQEAVGPDGTHVRVIQTYQDYNWAQFLSGNTWTNINSGGRFYDNELPIQFQYTLDSRNFLCFKAIGSSGRTFINSAYLITPTTINIPYETGTLNTNFGNTALDNISVVFPQTVLPSTASLDDILQAINDLALQNEQDISVEIDLQPQPQPTPVPIPTTPLGDVPYDEWYDTFGQSVFDAYNHIGLGQDALITVNQGIADDVDDLVGLETNINDGVSDIKSLFEDLNQELNDIDDYFQTYGTDVLDDLDDLSGEVGDIGTDVGYLHENVEDIEDEVIIIVDEMGNVIDVLEGIEAQEYANGQSLGNISTGVRDIGTALGRTATSAKQDEQTEVLEDVAEAVGDIVPYVPYIPNIKNGVDDIVDTMPDIKNNTDSLPDIVTNTDSLPDIKTNTDELPDIKDATQDIADTLPDVITSIQDATTTITDDIPNIDDICENIDEAPLKDIDTGVTRLPNIILPYLVDLRDALGIWHYVTEWVNSINSTFNFILGVLAGTSILTPIYASIAGYICIRAYRRMCN